MESHEAGLKFQLFTALIKIVQARASLAHATEKSRELLCFRAQHHPGTQKLPLDICALSLHFDYFSVGLTQRSLSQQLWAHVTLSTEDGRVGQGESLLAEGHNKDVGEVADGPVLSHVHL